MTWSLRLLRLWQRTPRWAIAVTIILLIMAYDLFFDPFWIDFRILWFGKVLAFFGAGALARLNWKHGLAAIGVAILFWIGDDWVNSIFAGLSYPYLAFAWTAPTFIALALAEAAMVSNGWNGRRTAWYVIAVIGATCVVVLMHELTRLMAWTYEFGRNPATSGFISNLIYWPLAAALAWIALSLAESAMKAEPKRARRRVVGSAGAIVIVFINCAQFVLPPLVRSSYLGRGPFDRSYSAAVLEARGSDEDIETLWQGLEAADLSGGEAFVRPHQDWRVTAIEALARRDTVETAARFSQLLRSRPSPLVGQRVAPMLAKYQRIETAPLLLRFALFDAALDGIDAEPCIAALEEMGVPQAALARIRAEIMNRAWENRPVVKVPEGEREVSPKARQRLTALLGEDAGTLIADWGALYDRKIGSLPSPLTAEQAEEANRTVDCSVRYFQLRERRYTAECRLYVMLAKDRGVSDNALKWMEDFVEKRRKGLIDRDPILPPAFMAKLESALNEARERMEVELPDLNVPTVDELEKEIDAYETRVERVIRKELEGDDSF